MDNNSDKRTDKICGESEGSREPTANGQRGKRFNRQEHVVELIKAAFPGSYLVDKLGEPLLGEIKTPAVIKQRKFKGSKLINEQQQELL